MKFLKSDIPFARDDAQRFLPAIVAAMVAIAALLLAIGLSFARSLETQQNDVAGSVQIQIPVTGSARDQATQDALAIVKSTPGVTDVVVLKKDEVQDLLKPWLGDEDALAGLDLPVLIDLKTRDVNGKAFDTKALQSNLATKIKNVRVETPLTWVEQLARVLRIVQAVLLLLALCLIASLVALAVLIARTSLRLHFKTVNLLHLFGATDDYILRQFQLHNGVMVGRGAAVGSVVAALVLLLVHIITGNLHSPVVPQVSFGFGHVALFIILPVMVALVSLLATRLTVQTMLHRMH